MEQKRQNRVTGRRKRRFAVWWGWVGLFVLLVMAGLAGCRQQETAVSPTPAPTTKPLPTDTAVPPTATSAPAPTTTPEPTPVPLSAKERTVCMAGEPESLYPFADKSLAATAVRHAIYENLTTSLGYAYQPQGLAALPDVRLEAVEVSVGDRVATADGHIAAMGEGVAFVGMDGVTRVFTDTAVLLPQLTVEFQLRPLVWSDGEAVTADDSLFSFELARENGDGRAARTAVYEAPDDLTVRWVGLPGYVPQDAIHNIWPPLPRHQLGELAPDEMPPVPLSSGPFVVADWRTGEIRLEPNPHYYREGLPRLDSLIIKTGVELSDDLWQSGECDVLAEDLFPPGSAGEALAAAGEAGWRLPAADNLALEHIALGVEPAPGVDRPDWFGRPEMRQALLMCLDRQQMVDELLAGQTAVLHTYLPADHPLYPADAAQWPYDPEEAQAMLAALGLTDGDGDGVLDDARGEPFRIRLSTDDASPLHREILERVQADLAACGVEVVADVRPPAELYADGPAGPLFGRRFDLGLFVWRTGIEPSCQLWLSDNTTGPAADGFGGWDNVNVTGWRDEAFDAACRTALLSPPASEAYAAGQTEAARIFSEQLPALPLFTLVKMAGETAVTHNVQLDPSQPSLFWNVAEWEAAP